MRAIAKPYSKEEIQFLKDNYLKMSGVEIAKELNRNKDSVNFKLKTLNLRSPFSIQVTEARQLRKNGKQRCTICRVIFDWTEDNFNRHGKWGLHGECKTCSRKLNNEYLDSKHLCLDTILGHKLTLIKRRKTWKLLVTKEELKDLFLKQNGKCFYTHRPLELKRNSKNHLTIDRINSLKDYSIDNIVLCCWVVNRMKGNLSCKDFKQICKEITSSLEQK